MRIQNLFLLCLIALLLGLPSLAPAQEPTQKVTVEWIYSPARFAVGKLPQHAWRSDGAALLEEPDGAGIAVLDPASGATTPAVDVAAASPPLKAILERMGGKPAWPAAFDDAGRKALYQGASGFYVMDLAASSWQRVPGAAGGAKAPRFSPDGRQLGFVAGNDLYVADLDRGAARRLTTDGSPTLLNGTCSWVYWEEIFGREDRAYWWSPEGDRIAFIQFDESEVDEVSFLHFVPAVPQVLTQRYPKAGHANPKVRVGIATTGAEPEVTWVTLAEENPEYIVRVSWTPDGSQLVVQTLDRAQRTLRVHLVDPETGEGTLLLTETDEGWVPPHDDLRFLGDGTFVWASQRDGYNHLYRFNMLGELVNRVTRGPWAVRGTSDVSWGRRGIAAIDEEGGWIFFTGHKDSALQIQLYRVRFDGTGLERLTRGPGVHKVEVGPEGRFFFDACSDHRTPPALRLVEVATGKERVLSEPKSAVIADFDLVAPEIFTIEARDGFEMPAYIYKPRDFDPARRYPLILHVYGGPSSPTVTDEWQRDIYFNRMLLDAGYLVGCIDNRSATAISKTLENTSLGQMFGDGELNDLLDGVKWFKSQTWIDPARVGIWGWSGGGSFTLLAMTRSQEFKAGIAVAAVTRWEYYDTIWGEAVMKRPEDNPEGYAHCDFTKRAKDLHGRLLLVHGTYDDNVHPQNVWHFIHELIEAGKIFELMIYPMRQHGISDIPARIHLYRTMLDFWTRNL